jgi:RNA polymerase sigma-70 factor (ECF subfamily)
MGISETDAAVSATVPESSDAGQHALYEHIATEFAAPMARLARAHEADPSLRQDLLQEIHVALWRSLPAFGGRCSLRTWVYRVAHNVAATHVQRRTRQRVESPATPEELELEVDGSDIGADIDEQRALARLTGLIWRLDPLDRQLMLLHLEGLPADELAEVTGLSPSNVHTRLHRIRQLLARRIRSGDFT